MFPVQGAGVQSLVRKVRFLVPHGVAKKKKIRDSNLTWHPVFSFAKSGNPTLKSSLYHSGPTSNFADGETKEVKCSHSAVSGNTRI